MRQHFGTRKPIIILAVALLTQCSDRVVEAADAVDPTPQVRTLETYRVPVNSQDEFMESLNDFVTVTNPANGLLLVSATQEQHRGIDDFIQEYAQLTEDDAPALEQRNIFTEYWLVAAAPGDSNDWEGLAAVQEALLAVQQSQGPMSFQLYNYSSGIGLEAERIELSNGMPVSIEHNLWTERDKIVGDISVARHFPVDTGNGIQFSSRGVETRVALVPGRFYVLGQIGSGGDEEMERLGATTMLFIIRTQVSD